MKTSTLTPAAQARALACLLEYFRQEPLVGATQLLKPVLSGQQQPHGAGGA